MSLKFLPNVIKALFCSSEVVHIYLIGLAALTPAIVRLVNLIGRLLVLKYLTSTVFMRKEEFKYPNSTPTNTEAFCDKISHLTDCVGGNYQVGDNIGDVGSGNYLIRNNIGVIGSGPLTRLFDNSTCMRLLCSS
ncbi:hypothetical protein DVH24_037751 [Malus domestica]|uniref:Uncharacterized protein n=1 Tax=Malus domestica TaxID=3750 RepID=A0A498K351_MALDO|nr:hypothetical protein DVH24_037751 [Malus domestica]